MYTTKGRGHADASDSPKHTASLDDPLSEPFIATLHNCSTWFLHHQFYEKFLYGLQILKKAHAESGTRLIARFRLFDDS